MCFGLIMNVIDIFSLFLKTLRVSSQTSWYRSGPLGARHLEHHPNKLLVHCRWNCCSQLPSGEPRHQNSKYSICICLQWYCCLFSSQNYFSHKKDVINDAKDWKIYNCLEIAICDWMESMLLNQMELIMCSPGLNAY